MKITVVSQPSSQPGPGSEEAPPRILLAEDDPEMLRPLAMALRDDGFEVEVAADAHELMARFRELAGSLALIVSDFPKSLNSGLEALREIRRLSTRTPIVLMTGSGDDVPA